MALASATPQRHVEFCMGTVFSIDVRSPGVDRSAVVEVVEWLHWVDGTFSTYRPGSEVSRLGRGELQVRQCHREVREILERCAELERRTGGYFSAHTGGRLDPSGYVKGWAIERASDLLSAAGSLNHCVNGGGDVQCAGTAGPGQPWRIGIADPTNRERLVGVAVGGRVAVATSGSAERGSHITDPHDGTRPDQLLSVTVVGQDLALVDAYATAAFAMGSRAAGWLAELPGVGWLVVGADGTICSSAGRGPATDGQPRIQPSSTTV